jgi:hypothetical protein
MANMQTATKKSRDKSATLSDKQFELILAQYNALRAEILKRSEIRYQIITINLVITGSILTFGLQTSSPSYVLFVFPMLGVFLASIWKHNGHWAQRASAYIREQIEKPIGIAGWESAVLKEPHSQRWLFRVSVSGSALFLGTQIITMSLGILRSSFSTLDVVMIVLDAVCVLLTMTILLRR